MGYEKTLIPSNEQYKLVRGQKLGGKLEGNEANHLWGWAMNPTKANQETKWSKTKQRSG